jgi:hypothetical protein
MAAGRLYFLPWVRRHPGAGLAVDNGVAQCAGGRSRGETSAAPEVLELDARDAAGYQVGAVSVHVRSVWRTVGRAKRGPSCGGLGGAVRDLLLVDRRSGVAAALFTQVGRSITNGSANYSSASGRWST